MSPIRLPVVLALLWLVAGCASTAPAVQTKLMSTDDLAVVVDDALALADQLGSDKVLVVFDIDNTLLAMEQGLGSDQWYDWQKRVQKGDACDERLVSDRLAVQGALYYASAMRTTQVDAARQVERLQNKDISVIALTSRGSDFSLHTFRELRRNGISFYATAIGSSRGFPEDFIPNEGSRPVRYEDGVFLTAGQHKGAMLRVLLTKTGTTRPKVIVMADDKEQNLQAMLETFDGSNTAVHAWRYSREDAAVAAFDFEQAIVLWHEIKPALQQLRRFLGPDHFDFPEYEKPQGCAD